MRRDVRLVTLTGPGGIGKTRLALEAGARAAERFAAGAVFVPLADVGGRELVPEALMAALGLRSSGTGAAAEELQGFLRRSEVLLAPDGFEPLADAAPLITELLPRRPP